LNESDIGTFEISIGTGDRDQFSVQYFVILTCENSKSGSTQESGSVFDRKWNASQRGFEWPANHPKAST
jgi:hypothetical protein